MDDLVTKVIQALAKLDLGYKVSGPKRRLQ